MALWKKPDGRSPPTAPAANSRLPDEQVGQSSQNIKPEMNGAAPELSGDKLRQMAGSAKAVTATFGEIVSLLMRSSSYKNYALTDLEWLVVPALLAGQFSVATAQSKTNGLTAPVGLVLWASVSEEIDKRLSAAPGQPPRLMPAEWKSGHILWVIVAAGDLRVVQGLLKQLQGKQWSNRDVKVFARDKDGTPSVTSLGRGGDSKSDE